ncbi:hypothetical protein BJY04DRAFT_213739 [Aspergillus karnatakaensis]|uniref:uncharacterized protein n=1 Tax=Aspergillus karnatakaensis TaxID=1810916 RepID=UPI003CCCC629
MASGGGSGGELAFRQALDRFRSILTAEEAQDFQLTTVGDLKTAIADLQAQQMSEKKMRNMTRLQRFVLGMQQFESVVTVYLNTSELVGFVWGPMKFLLLVACSYSEAFDAVVEFYETIGLNLPQLEQYQSLFHANEHMRTVLHLMYGDILEFHREALRLFKQRVWKQLFHATWKSLSIKLSRIVDSFQSHRMLLESQANLVQFAEYRRSASDAEERYRRRQEDEKNNHRRVVRAWLGAADAASDHETYIKYHRSHPESGNWLLNDRLIRTWCDSTLTSTPFLWMTGIPGAGKTFLASLLVEKITKAIPAPGCIVFFYCKHDDAGRNSFISIARSLIGQLSRCNKSLLPHLYQCATESEVGTLTSIGAAEDLLGLALRSIQRVYIVLDGIDECPPNQSRKIITWFQQQVESINNDSGDARCIFVSQDDQVCNKLLKNTPTLRISQDNNVDDIRAYCSLLSQAWIHDFRISDQHRKDVVDFIVANASGMFLFAKLVMRNLKRQVSREGFLKESGLKLLPKGLKEAYGRIISGILETENDIHASYARKLLGWIVCAKRSLSWYEIQGAVSIDLEANTIDYENRKLSVDSKQLLGSLVELRTDGRVELIHTIAKFYLLDQGHVLEKQEAFELCQLCLGYLCHPSVSQNLTTQTLRNYVSQGYYAFLDYAVTYWVYHLEDCLTYIHDSRQDILRSLKGYLSNFLEQHYEEGCPYTVSRKTKHIVCAFEGALFHDKLAEAFEYWKDETTVNACQPVDRLVLDLHKVVDTIRAEIEQTSQSISLQHFYGTRLFKCKRPYCKMFFEGFPNDIDRNQHTRQHERSFFCPVANCPASSVGFSSRGDLHSHVTKSHRGPKALGEFPVYQNPESIDIQHVCKTGNLAAVERWAAPLNPDTLVEKAGFWNKKTSAISIAIANGHVDVVEFLIEKSQHPSLHVPRVLRIACSSRKYEFLEWAFKSKRPITITHQDAPLLSSVTTLLLRRDDIFARDLISYLCDNGLDDFTVLIGDAIRNGCPISLGYMLDRTTILQGLIDNSEMIQAARTGRTEICRVLIDRGVWNSRDLTLAKRCLVEASVNGHEDTVTLLIGALLPNGNQEPWVGIVQLQKASRHGLPHTVKQVLQYKDMPLGLPDAGGRTPLHHAVENGHLEIVHLLIDSGADVGINQTASIDSATHGTITLCTPLTLAAFFGHTNIAEKILQREDVELSTCCIQHAPGASESRQCTALEVAQRLGHHELADAIDKYSQTAQSRDSLPFLGQYSQYLFGPPRPILPLSRRNELSAVTLQPRDQLLRQVQQVGTGARVTQAAAEEAWNNLPNGIKEQYQESAKYAPPTRNVTMTPLERMAVIQQLHECVDYLGKMDGLVHLLSLMPGSEKDIRSLLGMRFQLMSQFKPDSDWDLNDRITLEPEFVAGFMDYVKKLYDEFTFRPLVPPGTNFQLHPLPPNVPRPPLPGYLTGHHHPGYYP